MIAARAAALWAKVRVGMVVIRFPSRLSIEGESPGGRRYRRRDRR
jgi:hypothetical protein